MRQINRLYNYEWPGNVRELKNVIERIAILYASQELSEEDLESILNINPNEDNKEVPAFERPVTALPSSLKKATERFEENLIRQAYKETGSIVKAAKALGINPSTIHRKLSSGVIKFDLVSLPIAQCNMALALRNGTCNNSNGNPYFPNLQFYASRL